MSPNLKGTSKNLKKQTMKKIIIYSFLVLILIVRGQLFAQNVQTIDISTGVSNVTGLPLPSNTDDDSWVIAPINTPFNSLTTASYRETEVSYPYTYPAQSGSAKWVRPPNKLWPRYNYNVNYPWIMYFKINFYVANCNIQSAVLHFDEIGGDDSIEQIIVNTTVHPVSITMGPTPTTPNNTISTNITIPITGEIIQGWNTIYMRVRDEGLAYGLLVKGELNIASDGYIDFELLNKDGLRKTEYCIEEDVFLKETGLGLTAPFGLEISEMNGNTPVWTVPFGTNGIVTGNPIGVVPHGNKFHVTYC